MKSKSNNSLAKDILTTYPTYLNSNSFQKKSNGFAWIFLKIRNIFW